MEPKPLVPLGVADRPVAGPVAEAIHLNAKARPRAVEVEDVGAQRVLLAEGEAVLPPSLEALPEQGLRQGQGSAQTLGQGAGFGGCVHQVFRVRENPAEESRRI
jgi:hypothetical protein